MDWNAVLDDQAGDDDAFTVLPKGMYNVEVTAAEAAGPSSAGNRWVKVSCKVLDGPYENRMLWTNIVFVLTNSKAMKFTIAKLKALGVSQDWLRTANPSMDQIASRLVGATAVADVDDSKEYNGNKQNEIKTFKPLSVVSAAFVPPAPVLAPFDDDPF